MKSMLIAGTQTASARAIPFAFVLLALVAPAQLTPAQAPADATTITGGVLADWPPYYSIDAEGAPTGFAVELLDAVAARAGLRVRYRTFDSFADLQRALAQGTIDVIPNIGVVEGRDFLFTAPVDTFAVGVFIRESASGVRTVDDVRGRIAVVATNIGEQLVHGLAADEVVVVPDVRSAIFRLLAGEFEALIYPSPVVWALARGAHIDHQLVELEPALMEVKRAIATSPARPELYDRLDAALATFVGSFEYRAIYRRWHAPPATFWTPRRVAAIGAALIAVLTFAAALWRYLALRRFHRELGARERTFRALAEGLADCVMIIEPGDDVVRYVNSRSRELFGRDPEQLTGLSVRTLLPSELLADLSATPRQVRLEGADGARFDAEITVGPALAAAAPPGYLVRIADVTARHRADEQIRFQAHLLDVVAEAVIAIDLDGAVVYWNRFAERLFGWRSEEAVGRSALELTLPPESTEEAVAILARVRRGESWSGEIRLRRRDGTTFPAWAASAPVFDERGKVSGIVEIATDQTNRRELEDRLRQAQRMESVGRLAGGVAHDFNNLLTVISGNVELALSRLPPGDAGHAELVEIQHAADRAAALTQQLLAFSRKQVVRPRIVTIDSVLRGIETLLHRLLGEHIALSIRTDAHPGSVRADPAQLEQVIVNLAVNARDAMPRGGRLTIETGNVEIPSGSARLPPDLAPGGFVELTVRDSGVGMDAATLERIFDPFFTTKGPGEGTGLGLATVYGIVQQGGGTVEVESAPGAGSVFRVLLPRVEAAPAELAPSSPIRASGGRETILLVEDEDSLRRLFARSLAEGGYTVLAAARPSEAQRIAVGHEGTIHLLLTDLLLPEMNGAELCERISTMRPGIRVLFMSGYAEADIVAQSARAPETRRMSKPFTTSELAVAVREVLDGAS